MGDAFTGRSAGQLLQPASVKRVLVENRAADGVELSDGEVIEAPNVVVSAPVWNLPALFDEGVLPWDLMARIDFLRKNNNRACWIGLLDRGEGAGDRDDRAGDGVVLRHAAHRAAGLHAQLHRLRPRRLARGRVPHLRRRRVRRRRALRRPGLDRAEVHELWLDIEDMLPAAEERALEEAAPRHDLRRDQQAGPGRGGAPRHGRARRRRALPDRRHDPLARDRHRQGGPDRDHRGRGGAGSPAARFADTVRY